MSELEESVIRSQMFLMIERNRGKKPNLIHRIIKRALRCLKENHTS